MNERVHLTIRGRVQGVFYRASAQKAAQQRRLVGWVRNLPDGSVEALAEGSRDALEDFVAWCGVGPTAAAVEEVETVWGDATGEFDSFEIRR